MHKFTRNESTLVKNNFIRWFVKHYNVDMSLAQCEDPTAFRHFNDFFTRPLKTEARPICNNPQKIVCPVDGTVSQIGRINNSAIFQAKGRYFTLHELLARQDTWVDKFINGSFSTLYLSPKDYHRIHMPFDGTLRQMTYIPGKLFSVNAATARAVPRLFARNERVVCFFDTAIGPMAIILVGALFVGSMETVWHGLVTPPHGKSISHWYYNQQHNSQAESDMNSNQPQHQHLKKGAEMGRFNMGSTVILLFGPEVIQWESAIQPESTIQMGSELATSIEIADKSLNKVDTDIG
ncbi:MAG: phosphatidylserine decarboxylase [Gammaproteobacteria bacterium]|nr:phosphatidylserine decarboxylase [Gammaproteobacteria bacterium]